MNKILLAIIIFCLYLFSCTKNVKNPEFENKEDNMSYSENSDESMQLGESNISYSNSNFEQNDEDEGKDCSDAKTAGDEAYSYSRKAYNSDSWDDTKSYLKKAMNSFEDAMSYSDDCECDDAHSSAEDGYNFARKGYNSSDWDESKDYARKAKNEAEDVMSNAENCSN